MTKNLLFSSVLMLACTFMVFGQRTITGVVTSEEDEEVIPGVNVMLKGTNLGTTTDIDGKYRINVPVSGGVLVFSFIGMANREVEIKAQSVVDLQMTPDIQSLSEVVVTAQGIKKEAKSLGYGISEVEGKKMEQQSQADVGRILMGKTAGMNVTSTTGISGSGTNIIIRGYTSISGSNQPLFIVDGVPFSGGANQQTAYYDGMTESSRFLDLDPNNIENVSVLKGLSATVLYGDQGRNGVILITTKNGSSSKVSSKTEVSLNQSFYLSKAILPKYQKNYGAGYYQDYGYYFSNWGPSFKDDLSSSPYYYGVDTDGTTLLYHPFNYLADQTLTEGFEDIKATPYRYQAYNSVENFFRLGKVYNTSVNIRGGTAEKNFNMNFGNISDEGITPGNKLMRTNLGMGGTAVLTNKLIVNGTFNFALTDYATPPVAASWGSGVTGSGSSVFGDVMYTPASVDMTHMPYQTYDGRSIYYRSGNDIQNPYWTVHNVKVTQNVTRIYGQASAAYDLTKWLNIRYRFGLDEYTEMNSYGQNKGGVDGNIDGLYRTITANNKIYQHSILLSSQLHIRENFVLNSTIGGTTWRETYKQDGVESTEQIAFGVMKHYNFVNHSTINSFSGGQIASTTDQNRLGVYGDFSLGYKDYLFLNATARNDWTSTLEPENNSIFYPGASISFVPTDAFPVLNSKTLNYLKLRVGYGSSAGFPPAYRTRSTLDLTTRGFVNDDAVVVTTNSVSNRLGNPNLKAERVSEIEVGLDSRLFSRLSLNVSMYKKKTRDLITDQGLDDATGYTTTQVNVGEIEIKGLEFDYTLDLLDIGNFRWVLNGNFSAMENTVTKLNADKVNIRAYNYAIKGKPYGVLMGTVVERDDSGNLIVGSDGLYTTSATDGIIGDPNPDFTTALTNTFTYKGFSLSMDWLYRHGGDIFSYTAATLIGRGVVDTDKPMNRQASYILPGVTSEGATNNVQIAATDLGFDVYAYGPDEFKVFDGSTIRLNDITVGYTFSKKALEKTPFGRVSISVSGQNLWYDAYNFPKNLRYDTNSSSVGVSNGLGTDLLTGPSSRRYGISLKATL